MQNADIAVSGTDGRLQLVVEIKNVPGAPAEWVARLRRNLMAHSFLPHAPYFLLVLPDYLYLWTGASSADILANPEYKVEAAEVFAPYLKSNLSLNDLSRYGLELLTNSWLQDLLHKDSGHDPDDGSSQWLIDSGLYEAISNGSVELETTT